MCRAVVQGPTISHVYNLTSQNGSGENQAAKNYYAATICVRKKQLYGSVKALQKVRSLGAVAWSNVACLMAARAGCTFPVPRGSVLHGPRWGDRVQHQGRRHSAGVC